MGWQEMRCRQVVELVEMRRLETLGLWAVYLLEPCRRRRASLTCISPLRQPFLYTSNRETYYRREQKYPAAFFWIRGKKHRYRRTQLLGAGGC